MMCFTTILKNMFLAWAVLISTNDGNEMAEAQPIKSSDLSSATLIANFLEMNTVLREAMFFRDLLESETIPDLRVLYGTEFQLPKAKKILVMESKLRACKTSGDVLERIYKYLGKYVCHFNELQAFELQNNDVDFAEKMPRRKEILFTPGNQLRLLLTEVVESTYPDAETDCAEYKKYFFRDVPQRGNFGEMTTLDQQFVYHLKYFLDVVIKELTYRVRS